MSIFNKQFDEKKRCKNEGILNREYNKSTDVKTKILDHIFYR